MHALQQYIRHVLYYQLQLNQDWNVSLVQYILSSPYILIILGFSMEWIYLSVHWHVQDVTRDTVIKNGRSTKHMSIVSYIVGSSWPHFHYLGDTGLSKEDEHNRRICHCIRRGFIIFTFLATSLSYLFLPRSLLFFI